MQPYTRDRLIEQFQAILPDATEEQIDDFCNIFFQAMWEEISEDVNRLIFHYGTEL